MPIYEFRCLDCNECFEFLIMNKEEQVEMKCPKCESEEFERILSVACHSMEEGSSKSNTPISKTRSCSGGSCTTYDIPGHSR